MTAATLSKATRTRVDARFRTILREELAAAGVARILDAYREISQAVGDTPDAAALGRRVRMIVREEALARSATGHAPEPVR